MVSGKAANARRVKEWRERQRENPEKHEEYKRKERERNKKRREKGLIQPIGNLGERDQRSQRRKWKINQRNKRQNDKDLQKQLESIETPPMSPSQAAAANITVPSARAETLQRTGRKKVRKDRAKAYRDIYKLKIKLQKEQKQKLKYKKRYQRLATKKSKSRTLNKKVDEMIRTNETKKALLVHQSIVDRIKNRYMKSKSQKEKQMISSLICSYRMMRTNRLLTYFRKVTGITKHYNGKRPTERRRPTKPLRLKAAVSAFLERDDNTRLKAGKKSTITRQGEKRQIRLLTDDLKHLYAKFLNEYTGKMSYSLFCFLRPFHIRVPTATDRDTCQCKIHENIKFKVEKCKQHGVLSTNEMDSIIQTITCDPKNKECMYRECQTCKDQSIDFDLTNGDDQVSWSVWKSQRHEREKTTNGKTTTTTVSMTVKEPDYGSLRILSEELQKDIQKVTRHIFNIRHQYQSLRFLRDRMNHEEIIMHIDFSENYNCKYSSEIQSMHFGASQRQISLHTGVAYVAEKTFSFCTASDCLKHGPAAIWAHLHPVISNLKEESGAKRIHFISDGPTTQYRNKHNMYFFSQKIYQYGFEGGTWNFLEAAHGKGAADGVGAAVKRLADRSVLVTGKDIMSASDIKGLASETKVSLYTISEEDISNIEADIPSNIKPIPKTMQIHQLVTKTRGNVLHRVLSCFCGGEFLECICFTPSTTVFNIEVSKTSKQFLRALFHT
ncbi:uncharacterized protein LOC117324573 [Pecten maximus]|uniref:uncharacterized protein LOC117324573 n=1 Tax=Pecten maximus TaxID=6579 RepID=UPI001457F1D5|nr:uncharacterized protein LOC117324573 [Pecten maximus]